MSLVRPAISILLLLLTALGLHNVYADHTPVLEQAKSVACKSCNVSLSQLSKSPIKHTYFLATGSGTVVVECQRTYIFVGEYVCHKQAD
jgi:hypothetical protein